MRLSPIRITLVLLLAMLAMPGSASAGLFSDGGIFNRNNPSTGGGGGGVAISGDISIGTTGAATVAAIRGVTVSGTSGTGSVAFTSSATLSGVTLNSSSVLTDAINKTSAISTSTLTKTSSITYTVVPGLYVNLAANGSYLCFGHLTGTAGAAGGISVQLQTADSLTVNSLSVTGTNWNGTTLNAKSTATALSSSFGNATAVYTDLDIVAGINVNAGGGIGVYAAQNASSGTSTTVLANSVFFCNRTN